MPENTSFKLARDFSWMTVSGYVLICTAFVLPVIVSMLGAENTVNLTESVPAMLGALLVIGGITAAIVRSRTSRAKSIGMLVVGVLMCSVSFSDVQRSAQEAHDARFFFKKAVAFNDSRAAAFLEFKERFERFDMSTIVTAQTLSSPAGRAEGRSRLAEYRALLAERKALLATHFSEYERFINENSAAFDKTATMDALRAGTGPIAQVYNELHVTQSAVADAMFEMLDWSEANASKFKPSGSGLQFASTATQVQFNERLQKLKQLQLHAIATAQRLEASQAHNRALIEKNTATLRSLAQ